MVRPRTKNKAVCQNSGCHYFHKKKGKEITKQGSNPAGHQRYRCEYCGVNSFSLQHLHWVKELKEHADCFLMNLKI